MKFDGGKRRYTLLAWDAIGALVDVLEHGAKKYAPNNWELVARGGDGRQRYFDAIQRHIVAWWMGESDDPETGLPHLAHAMADVMFLLANDLRTRGAK